MKELPLSGLHFFAVLVAFSAALASRTFAFSAALASASRAFSHVRTSRRRNWDATPRPLWWIGIPDRSHFVTTCLSTPKCSASSDRVNTRAFAIVFLQVALPPPVFEEKGSCPEVVDRGRNRGSVSFQLNQATGARRGRAGRSTPPDAQDKTRPSALRRLRNAASTPARSPRAARHPAEPAWEAGRVPLASPLLVVRRRGDRQSSADRLDPCVSRCSSMNDTIISVGGRAPPGRNRPTPCAGCHWSCAGEALIERLTTPIGTPSPRRSGSRGSSSAPSRRFRPCRAAPSYAAHSPPPCTAVTARRPPRWPRSDLEPRIR